MTLLESKHIQHKISDFVLDLLPVEEKQAVSRHLADCAECRQAVQRERQIGRLIHTTLASATRPKAAQLQSLMPVIPSQRPSLLTLITPYRQWAVACLLIVAMMGAFIFGGGNGYKGIVRQAVTHPATISSLYNTGTAAPLTTRPADTLFTTLQPEESITSNYLVEPDFSQPPAAPLPVAPQVTPAPAATYFQ